MNITILNGSPHPKGTSALLLENFTNGATKNGHVVNTFDLRGLNIHPCIGCDHCRDEDTLHQCVFSDGMSKLFPSLLEADLVVFVTPLYYFGMSSQLKAAIDRFYAYNSDLKGANKKALLLATCGDKGSQTFAALKLHYEAVCEYLQWEDLGQLLADDVYVRADMENSDFPTQAFDLGASI